MSRFFRTKTVDTVVFPDSWPSGATNPDSAFFVPEELRPFYVIDRDQESALRSAKCARTDLSVLDRETVLSRVAVDDRMRARGLNPDESEAWALFIRGHAASLSEDDRLLYLHKLRLHAAQMQLAEQARAEAEAKAYRLAHTCEGCGEVHSTTRRVGFGRGGRRAVPGAVVVSQIERLCVACADLAERLAGEEWGREVTAEGRTRQDVVSALLGSGHQVPAKESS